MLCHKLVYVTNRAVSFLRSQSPLTCSSAFTTPSKTDHMITPKTPTFPFPRQIFSVFLFFTISHHFQPFPLPFPPLANPVFISISSIKTHYHFLMSTISTTIPYHFFLPFLEMVEMVGNGKSKKTHFFSQNPKNRNDHFAPSFDHFCHPLCIHMTKSQSQHDFCIPFPLHRRAGPFCKKFGDRAIPRRQGSWNNPFLVGRWVYRRMFSDPVQISCFGI